MSKVLLEILDEMHAIYTEALREALKLPESAVFKRMSMTSEEYDEFLESDEFKKFVFVSGHSTNGKISFEGFFTE